MTNDTYSGNRHIYMGIEHISTHLIGLHGNIPRWGTSQLGISLISSDLVFQHQLGNFIVQNDTYSETDIFMWVLSIFHFTSNWMLHG